MTRVHLTCAALALIAVTGLAHATGEYPPQTAAMVGAVYPDATHDIESLGGDYYTDCDAVSCSITYWSVADLGPQPSPAELDAAALPHFRTACIKDAGTTRTETVLAGPPDGMLPDELAIVRTEPVAPEYQSRRQWWDALIAQYDAYVGPAGPVQTATAATELSPCPPLDYPTFPEWKEAQQ